MVADGGERSDVEEKSTVLKPFHFNGLEAILASLSG
jgi:hypothetical protein